MDVRLAAFENEPLAALHATLAALVTDPASVTVSPAHAVWVEPAADVGAGVTLIVTVLVAGTAQGELGWAVSVSVILPLVMLGVYVDVRLAALENVPLAALHAELAALVTAPARVIVSPAHAVWAEPAADVGAGVTVRVARLLVALPQALLT